MTCDVLQVNIVGLQEKLVVSEEELLNAMDAGNVARCDVCARIAR